MTSGSIIQETYGIHTRVSKPGHWSAPSGYPHIFVLDNAPKSLILHAICTFFMVASSVWNNNEMKQLI